MKVISRLSFLVVLAASAFPLLAQSSNTAIYIRSNVNQPWGQVTNEDAMDNVFGAGAWSTQYFETLDPGQVLASTTQFIFMEGGDSSYAAFSTFMTNHVNDVTNWISNGGRLLIMSAPNDPLSDAYLYLPGNIILKSDAFYGSAASSAFATDVSNPMFMGPNTFTGTNFTGNFFSHGYFVGANVSQIMRTNLNQVVLGQYATGTGLMVFGGMTTDNFQLPQPAAHNLLENIIYYTATTTIGA